MMTPEINDRFEVFDKAEFRAHGESKYITTLSDRTTEHEAQPDGYIRRSWFEGSPFMLIEHFYESGGLKEKGLLFIEGSPIGTWYEFNENGSLTDRVDSDEGYDFGWEDVLRYCEENKIMLPKGYDPTGFKTSLYREEDTEGGGPIWLITIQVSPDRLQEIYLDGGDGKELRTKSLDYMNN